MAYPADYDSDSQSEVDSWAPDDYYDSYEDELPYEDDDYYTWKKPNTYILVPKFRELISEHPDGILLKDLPDVYFRRFREKLNWTDFGYKTLEELLTVYPDIITCIERGRNRDEWLIVDATRSDLNEPPSWSDTDESKPTPMLVESNVTPLPTAYKPISKPDESNATSKPISYRPIRKLDESNSTRMPIAYEPIPKPDESNATSKPIAYRAIRKVDESTSTRMPIAYEPIPKPEESNATSRPIAYRPIRKLDESTSTRMPIAYEPIPKPDESNSTPTPTAHKPNPKPDESKPTPHPDKTERSPHPDVDSPKPSPRFDPHLIDAVIEEITARLFPPGSDFWNSMFLRPVGIPPLLQNTIRSENSENKSSQPKEHPKPESQKAKCASPTQSPNDAAGKPSTEYSAPPSASTSKPQQLTLNLCRVCFSKPENGVFIHENVGHVHGCYSCAKKNWYHNGDCPVCQRHVFNVVELLF